jgi:paraquat-inducible protein B
LEVPPVVTTDLPGSHFVLRASSLGSLNIGAPIYFRRIEVGQVVSYKLDEDGQAVTVKVFVHDPHHQLVRKNTRFWSASGLDVAIGADGIRVDTESFVTLMIGGIAFDTPPNQEPGEPAAENDVFDLYKNRESMSEKIYVKKNRWLLHFDGGVRGLNSGAPVELQGIQVGQVLDVNLEFDVEKGAFRVPVLIETEPGRIRTIGKFPEGAEKQKVMDYLVGKGMRAQLKTGSLITGQLLVALDMHPEAPPAKINWEGSYPEVPTVPTAMDEITTSLTQLLKKLEKLPIEQIGNDLRDTVAGAKQLINSPDLQKSVTALNKTLNQAQKFVSTLNKDVAPEMKSAVSNLNATLIQAQKLAKSLNSNVAPQADRTLKELQSAARSIKVWAEYLERHPEALIRGKGKSKRR